MEIRLVFRLNLISTLVQSFYDLLEKQAGSGIINKIRSILIINDYHEDVITSTFQRKLKQLNARPIHSTDKCNSLSLDFLANQSSSVGRFLLASSNQSELFLSLCKSGRLTYFPFWRFPMKSVRWKALGKWIFYFEPKIVNNVISKYA